MTVLDRIVAAKREEAAALRRSRTPASFRSGWGYGQPVRSLAGALAEGAAPSVIAEFKRASPSAGIINAAARPAETAAGYVRNGASAISVLTDRGFFSGSGEDLGEARTAAAVPVLRKDFLIDPIQLPESRSFGADAVLLIAAILEPARLADLHAAAAAEGLECLVEVHAPAELDGIDLDRVRLIGVNNRDLRDFSVDLGATAAVARLLPSGPLLVSESGLRTAADVARVVRDGARAVLVGEQFMRDPDPGSRLGAMLREIREN